MPPAFIWRSSPADLRAPGANSSGRVMVRKVAGLAIESERDCALLGQVFSALD